MVPELNLSVLFLLILFFKALKRALLIPFPCFSSLTHTQVHWPLQLDMVDTQRELVQKLCYWLLLSPWWLLAGIPIKSTMDNTTTIQYAGLMHSFIMKARSTVRDIDPQNDLTFLRIRSKKNEIMVAPGKRKESESRCQSIQQILLVMSVRVACWFLCGRDAVSWEVSSACCFYSCYLLYSFPKTLSFVAFFHWKLLSLTLVCFFML